MEIKPCAHCGGDAEIFNDGCDGFNNIYIICKCCHMQTVNHESNEDCVDVWNSRVEQPSEADRWLNEATEQRARADLLQMQNDQLNEALEHAKRMLDYAGKMQ